MRIYEIAKPKESKNYLQNLDVDKVGINILSQKMDYFYIAIKDIKAAALNILKQDALSVGADVAAPSGVIACKKEFYDCLLFGTKRQLLRLATKELAQPFGLKELGKRLREILYKKNFPIKIMGVINANDDSFYEGSRFKGKDAIKKIEQMIEDGANIIDVGALSSRPGSKPIPQEEELIRVQEILEAIKKEKLYKKALFSIDSYAPLVVQAALDRGFRIINDITGAKDDRLLKLAKEYKAKICIMHMQGTPETMQINPQYKDVVSEVDEFFQKRIQKAQNFGLKKEDIILDVGIGFGKTLEHNLALLRSHAHFMHFGCELLIGASRKSLINAITPAPVQERLPGTLAIHLKAIERGASIVRCHDVKEHAQAIKIWQEL